VRLRHPDGTVVHLAYCTNVHAAEDVDGVLGQLARYAEPIRRTLGVDRLGVGLWLAVNVIRELTPTAVRRLRTELTTRGLEVVTLNAFPYAGFHQPVVKKAVYLPDWADPRRLDYTLACARVLAELLPDDVLRGSVSTVPLAWRTPWPPDRAALAHRALDTLATGLADLHRTTGRRIRVGLEPEPGCVIETTDQAVTELASVDHEWLGVCLDACHLAVAFEDPATAVARLVDAGLPIVKTQASNALQADDPTTDALSRFAEPKFLHQTKTIVDGQLWSADDLPNDLSTTSPWRVHYHVPLHAPAVPPLRTTADTLTDTLGALFDTPQARTDHVEVETYTWSVLPDAAGLVEGIAAELAWTRDRLVAMGLKEEPA
jgi:sugar phosphate isomerase/epimerase